MQKRKLILGLFLLSQSAVGAMSVKITSAQGATTTGQYTPVSKPSKTWRVLVIFPNSQDPFWLAAHYGVTQEAKRLGIGLKVVSAKSYADLAGQNALLDAALTEKVDAIILSPINSKLQNPKIENLIRQKKVPLISLINPVFSNLVAARRQMDYADPGKMAAEFVLRESKGRSVNVALLPGPAGAGWTEGMYNGFIQTIGRRANVKIVATKWGDTSEAVQSKLLQDLLGKGQSIDYIVGNAVASEVAVGILAKSNLSQKTKIVSLYNNTGVIQGIKNNKIAMSPNDYTATLAASAVGTAVQILEGRSVAPVMGPVLTEMTPANFSKINYTETFAPDKYRPVALINWK